MGAVERYIPSGVAAIKSPTEGGNVGGSDCAVVVAAGTGVGSGSGSGSGVVTGMREATETQPRLGWGRSVEGRWDETTVPVQAPVVHVP